MELMNNNLKDVIQTEIPIQQIFLETKCKNSKLKSFYENLKNLHHC